jgi:sarcosine oxidase subunit alpha
MGAAELTVLGGLGARLFRISFSGELAFELAVPADSGERAVRALMETGRAFDAVPYGLEALNVMRIEKGHVGGAELTGHATMGDLGLAKMMSAKKDHVGRIMAGRPGLSDPARPALVGFKPADRARPLQAGAHFIARGAAATTENDLGFMSSVAYSPTLGHWIGLGFLSRGTERRGEILRACNPICGIETLVEVTDRVFFDPKGERLHG